MNKWLNFDGDPDHHGSMLTFQIGNQGNMGVMTWLGQGGLQSLSAFVVQSKVIPNRWSISNLHKPDLCLKYECTISGFFSCYFVTSWCFWDTSLSFTCFSLCLLLSCYVYFVSISSLMHAIHAFFDTATNTVQNFVAFKSYLLQFDSMQLNTQFHVFRGTTHLISSMQFSSFNANPFIVPRLFVADPCLWPDHERQDSPGIFFMVQCNAK